MVYGGQPNDKEKSKLYGTLQVIYNYVCIFTASSLKILPKSLLLLLPVTQQEKRWELKEPKSLSSSSFCSLLLH